jgi:predicted transcriptional regulator
LLKNLDKDENESGDPVLDKLGKLQGDVKEINENLEKIKSTNS